MIKLNVKGIECIIDDAKREEDSIVTRLARELGRIYGIDDIYATIEGGPEDEDETLYMYDYETNIRGLKRIKSNITIDVPVTLLVKE